MTGDATFTKVQPKKVKISGQQNAEADHSASAFSLLDLEM